MLINYFGFSVEMDCWIAVVVLSRVGAELPKMLAAT